MANFDLLSYGNMTSLSHAVVQYWDRIQIGAIGSNSETKSVEMQEYDGWWCTHISPVARKSPSDAEKEASDQLERELQSNETYKDAPSLERQMSVKLTISPSYVEDWNSTDAFREFHQNWRDAILERFDLDHLEFQPYYEDKGDCVSIVVPDPTDQRQRRRALGFIKYEKKAGRVILANPCAQLQPEALQLGCTSKQGNPNLAGYCGKGLKLAALAMSRNGYKVKVATSNWYFHDQEESEKGISIALWDALGSVPPIRTPEEEQAKLFLGAEVCALPESAFGRTISRALRACLAMYKQTEHMSIHFIHSDISDIEVAFDANRHALKIHQKWLEFDTLHRQHACRDVVPDNKAGQDAMIFCDHVIEELLRISLATISSILLISFHNKSEMMREVRHRLRLMPHSIDLKQSLPGMLMVTWEDNETELFRRHYGPRVTYHVVLHGETCVGSESELLHGDKVIRPSKRAPCGCAQRLTTQDSRMAEFTNLDCSRRYFPMVALNTKLAIYGLPPRPKFPMEQDRSTAVASLMVLGFEGMPDMPDQPLKRQKRN
ncbi:hypothetical protein PENSOL_c023G00732 [Penicillium solitum]|uniref:Uncharacterized protein n=1 Tax=Penicillium solitum TaxID=60172 RepID=A0A1V6R0B7_9EURO|nr:uncharacterized protein PENSOL_c023G00732 [Penicillium solitum]OQD94904.1 hypothetical protein PENSOL_c023G00732 [Penicillium solitum]